MVGAIILLVAIVALTVGLRVIRRASAPKPGEAFSIQGRQHIPVGQAHPTYNSVPPTSGWHYADQVAPWGIATAPIANEVQVHNLEHGGIVIQYKDANDIALLSQLTAIVKSYETKIVLAPYPDMPSRVALTAWGRRQTFDQYDEAGMRAFIAAYISKGPENVP